MSLINQMLRDLEERRKTEAPQLSAKPVTSSPLVSSAGMRWLWVALFGVALGGLVWFGLKLVPDSPPAATSVKVRPADPVVTTKGVEPVTLPLVSSPPKKTVALSPPPVTAAAKPVVASRQPATEKVVKKDAPVIVERISPQPKVETKKRPGIVASAKGEPKVSAAPASGIDLNVKGGSKNVSLNDLGVVEGVDSVRLMFEFAKLPAYRVSSDKQDPGTLTVHFPDTDKGGRLEIPPFRGPLLSHLELVPVKPHLQLKLGVTRPVKVQAYALPADANNGERLLVDLSVDRGAQVLTAGAGQGQSVSSGADAKEQAEILTRKAVRYLEQGNAGAAKTQFAKALELTPGNVELRQQLVDLLIKDRQQEKAENLLLAGLTLAPRDPALRTRYGRMLFDRNQLAEALELMLAKPIPALTEQPDYHALLAALEQESGLFVNAATRYRELLQVRPSQAEWWLLLAITYEQLNETKLASSAYRQALEKAGLSTEHRQFSLDRLERLQRLQD
ncbi:MAG TPA: tetratricopeptide repeat protein [Malonomonas sp.]